METKLNCWEFKKCGREPGGEKVAELGVCPASTDESCNEVNSGKKSGRICWVTSGTFCGGQVQGTFAQKEATCMICDFFKLVAKEEGSQFKTFKPCKVVR